MPDQPVSPIPFLSWERGQQPVFDRRWNDVKTVRCLRLFTDNEQKLALPSLFRHSKVLDPMNRRFVEMDELPQHIDIPLLAANQLGCSRGENGAAKLVRFVGSPRKI